jgi:hypothetical protein
VPSTVHVGFVVDEAALGQVLLRVLRFSPANIIPPWVSTLIHYLGDNYRYAGGRSSETSSHPIEINKYYRVIQSSTRILKEGVVVIISSESINKVYTNPSPFQLLRFNAHVIFTIVVVDFYKMETIRYNVTCQPSSYWQ